MNEAPTTALTEPVRRSTLLRWGPVVAGAAVWWALYHYNLPFWDWVIYDLVGLDPQSQLGESVHFFFYDVTKIALLLTGVIFVVTILRSFMSVERTRALLGGRRQGVGNVAAAGLGVVDPVLLVLGGAGVHRVRRRRRATRGDAQLPDRLPDGQRGRDRAAVRPVRLEGHRAVHRRRVVHRDRRRHGARPNESRAVGRAVRVRDQAPRQADRPVARAVVGRPHPDGSRGSRHDSAQGVALPARRHRCRRRDPRLGAGGLVRPDTPPACSACQSPC